MEDRGVLGGAHPAAKLILLVILALVGLFVTMIVGMLAAIPFFGQEVFTQLLQGGGLDLTQNLNYSRYFQTLSHIGLFIVPSIVFAILVGRMPFIYLKGKRKPWLVSLLVAAMIMVAALPLVNLLMEINLKLSLPQSFSGIEEWMRRAEEGAEAITKMFLGVSSWQALLFNVFMIAVIPAIGEEFIFRGILLKVLRQWFGSVHAAVWVSAFIFSAIHMQFFGFLPRLLLGVVLGYMFVWSANIWVPVFAHFFNNAAAVIIYYLYHNDRINIEIEKFGTGPDMIFYAGASVLLLIALFAFFKKYEKERMKRLSFD